MIMVFRKRPSGTLTLGVWNNYVYLCCDAALGVVCIETEYIIASVHVL